MRFVRIAGMVLWNVALPLSASVGVVGLGLFLYSQTDGVVAAPADRYDVLRDTLSVVLAITAIVLAVLSLGAYRVLRLTLSERISKEIGEKYLLVMIRSQLSAGYLHWDQYRNTRHWFSLEYAIRVTGEAYTHIQDLGDRRLANEAQECEVVNNWGYFLAEKAKACNQGVWEGEPIGE